MLYITRGWPALSLTRFMVYRWETSMTVWHASATPPLLQIVGADSVVERAAGIRALRQSDGDAGDQ